MTIESDKYWTAEAENKLGSWNEVKVMTLFFFFKTQNVMRYFKQYVHTSKKKSFIFPQRLSGVKFIPSGE